MAKKNINTILILGVAVAAILIIRQWNKSKKRSTVEAGPLEKITADEYETATTYPTDADTVVTKAKSVLDVLKTLKRTPEQKAAALARKTARKQKRSQKSGTTVKDSGMGRADEISVLC